MKSYSMKKIVLNLTVVILGISFIIGSGGGGESGSVTQDSSSSTSDVNQGASSPISDVTQDSLNPTPQELISVAKEILNDNTVSNITEEEFNSSKYAQHHLPDGDAQRLTEAHMLVATATDPDPEWFATEADRQVVLAKAGDNYTVYLNKRSVDGTVSGPVDNDKLRLVVRIQRGKTDFENVSSADIGNYARWSSTGKLDVSVPSDLNQGRLLVGVRPNLGDEASNAIAERWSTVVIAEIWQTKAGVKTVDTDSVIFPIDNDTTSGFETGSQFTKDDIAPKVQEELTKNNTLMFPIIVKDMSLQIGDLISYMFRGKPYSGKIFSLESRGNQQLALMTPELFEVYHITDANDRFMITQGLYPEHVVFRGGEVIVDDNSDASIQEKSFLEFSFFDVKCSLGKMGYTFEPKFTLSPPEIDIAFSMYGIGGGKTECKLEATPDDIVLNNLFLFVSGGLTGIITKIFGSEVALKPYGELALSTNSPGFGFSTGYSTSKGSYFRLLSLPNYLKAGSRDLKVIKAELEAEFASNLGIGLKPSPYTQLKSIPEFPLQAVSHRYNLGFAEALSRYF